MPKFKPHTSTGKRVKVTGSGKLVHARSGKRHHLELKSSRRIRRISGTTELAGADAKRVNRLLGR